MSPYDGNPPAPTWPSPSTTPPPSTAPPSTAPPSTAPPSATPQPSAPWHGSPGQPPVAYQPWVPGYQPSQMYQPSATYRPTVAYEPVEWERRGGVAARLPRPLLLLLVLGTLFLPFLTMSCSSPVGEVGMEFSGWNSTLGTEPSTFGADGGAEGSAGGSADAQSDERPSAEARTLGAFMVIAGWGFLAIVGIGAVVLLCLPSPRARSWCGAVVGFLAAAALAANHLSLRGLVDAWIDEAAAEEGTDGLLADLDLASLISVETRWGFWLAVGYLGVFAAANVFVLIFPKDVPFEYGVPAPYGYPYGPDLASPVVPPAATDPPAPAGPRPPVAAGPPVPGAPVPGAPVPPAPATLAPVDAYVGRHARRGDPPSPR